MGTEERLRGILRRFSEQRILVAGDLILDRYWWGSATRLSPEAPVPVVKREKTTVRPGGAANTAVNLVALGAWTELFGVAGEDRDAAELTAALADGGMSRNVWLSVERDGQTTTKTRMMALNQQVVRVDDESVLPIPAELAAEAAAQIAERLARCRAIVFSDYDKGFLTPALLRAASHRPAPPTRRSSLTPRAAMLSATKGARCLSRTARNWVCWPVWRFTRARIRGQRENTSLREWPAPRF